MRALCCPIAATTKPFVGVARKADEETIDRIKSLNLRGIHFQKESRRFYPSENWRRRLFGDVGTDDGGLSGIEREFDDELRGARARCRSR